MDYINLYKLNKEIEQSRITRNDILNNFIKDSNHAIHNLNIDYLTKVPFPLILVNRNIFENDLVKVKIYSKDYKYLDYFFNDKGLISDNKEELELFESILPFIKGLFRVKKEERILDNAFYEDLVINLYNRYVDKVIINGYGIDLENIKVDLRRYKNILKKISIINNQELDKYKINKSKKKILEIYRG